MAVDYAMTGRAEDPYPTRANTMSATYGGLGGQVSPSFGNTATPQFGSNTSGQRFADLQSALGNIGYQRSGIQRERATTLDDLSRQFRESRRPIPGQFNRRGMLDSGQYQRAVGRTFEDELRRAGRYELGVQEALNALAAQQLGAEQQYASGRLQDALNAAQAKAQQMATIREGTFPALSSTAAAAAAPAMGIPTLPDIPPPIVAPPPPAPAPAPVPVAAPAPAPAPVAAPPPAPEVVPDLARMAAAQTAWDERMAARSAQQEIARAAALEPGGPIEFFYPEQGGFGSTSIAPTWLNPGGVASHVISVPWEGTGGPGDPAFQALMEAAAQRMTENMIYDPNLHAHGGGYTSKPGARERVERERLAREIREATG
jgi:hypothetical protein